MHWQHFSKDLMSIHVWRQAQTQSNIDNFYEEDMNIFNPRRSDRGNTDGIFRMEFPLMQWLVAATYKIFGKYLIISRLWMFAIGLLTILGIYKLLYALFDNALIGIIGAWAFNFSPTFFYYTINPLPDNMALCAAIWGLYIFFYWYRHRRDSLLVWSGVFLAIGTLCKLPFIIYYIVPIVYFLQQLFQKGWQKELLPQGLKVFGFSVFPVGWYITVIPQWGDNMVISGMLENEDSSSKIFDYLQHNLISTLPELLLNYGSVPFFLAGFYYLQKRKAYKNPLFLMLLGLSSVVLFYFLFEVNAIAKIHDYYLFPFYPLLFILVGYGAYHFMNAGKLVRNFSFLLLMILPFTCYLRMQSRWTPDAPGFNKNLLIHKEVLQNAVPNDALVVAGNDLSHYIFFYYIDKKGWGFDQDRLSAAELKEMIENGAQYLYSDTKMVHDNPEVKPFLEKLLIQKGDIFVYKLKK